MSHVTKLVFSAMVITLINKAGIATGFITWYFLGTSNQLMVQVPLAMAVSICGTMIWLLKFGHWHRLDLEQDAMALFLLILPVGAALWVPIHYLWTGYLTSMGNIVGGWIFAFLANIPAFALSAGVWRRRTERQA
jgi:hypothetical protein